MPGKVVAVVGPTASGKTKLSIAIAEAFGGEVISADSRQIYRGMDIGTAKPSHEEMRGIPHHLIDIKNPDEPYTVAEYKQDAVAAIEAVLRGGDLPILAGGTGLYVRAVVENLAIPHVASDPELRASLEKEMSAKGLPALFQKLVALDPEAAYIVDSNNPRRVIRALEVALATGKPFTAQRKKHPPLFHFLQIGICPTPEVLRERINTRIDAMLTDGLVAEVETLLKKYGEAIALDAIGYREIIGYLRGETSLVAAVALMKTNTWHYAKRQLTWFRRDKEIHWITDPHEALALVKGFLKK